VNSVEQHIRTRLDALPAQLAPLADMTLKYSRYCSAVDTDDTLLVGHMPWTAPQAYAFRLYPGAKKAWFERYSQAPIECQIPPSFRQVLSAVNGLFAFGMSLDGIPPSRLSDTHSLDRSKLQCFDLATANQNWKREYRGAPEGFHFGGRHYSASENSGYFLTGKSRITSVLKDGRIVGEWDEFNVFLRDELRAAEEFETAKIEPGWWR
jgi:hypothetical protein